MRGNGRRRVEEFAPATAERIATNDSIFRDANERIRAAAERYAMENRIPFLCECADPTCTDVLRLTLDEYRETRSSPRWFATASGHQGPEGEAEVVARYDGHLVVEKTGRAGELAEELAS